MRSGRRKTKLRAPKGEAFQVLDEKGVVLLDDAVSADVALVQGQSLLEALGLGKTRDKNIRYTVRLKPLSGPPDDIYHVVLSREGAILTAPASALK